MAADLPAEILAEIFSRLPVKSLLRLRSTSKSLKSLIDSQKFINLHLKNNSLLNRSLILLHKSELYQLQIDGDLSNPAKSSLILLKHHPFKHNINTNIDPLLSNSTIALLGSCNGLLAISNGQIAFTHSHGANEITFWNPNTRKHRIIPFLPLPIPEIMEYDKTNRAVFCVHGFGFDPLSEDYKLLRISFLVDLRNRSGDSHVRLFSSKTNSWKIIPNMPYSIYYLRTRGVFLDNSLHWIMTPKIVGSNRCLIVAFNLTLEIFSEVPLPDEIGGEEVSSNESFEIFVSDLGGCLCLTVNYRTTKVDVWVMKEYGCRDSWCKIFTLVKSNFNLPLKTLWPLGYSSDGKKVLFEVYLEKPFWYDLKSEQVSSVEGIPNMEEAMICVGSLVPPPLPVVDICKKKENLTSKNKRRDDFLSQGFKLRL